MKYYNDLPMSSIDDENKLEFKSIAEPMSSWLYPGGSGSSSSGMCGFSGRHAKYVVDNLYNGSNIRDNIYKSLIEIGTSDFSNTLSSIEKKVDVVFQNLLATIRDKKIDDILK